MIRDFNEIKKAFPEDVWDVGWLSKEDLVNLVNSPIKMNDNPLWKVEDNDIGLIFIKHTPRYDYSINVEIKVWLNQQKMNWSYVNMNLKKAGVLAGKGQQAKNTVFYSDRFGFDVHLMAYVLHEEEFINLPKRKTPNFNFLPQCEGCNDCAKACPVQAIHNDILQNIWVDAQKCMNFCDFGDHPTIPSIKYGWRNLVMPGMEEETLQMIKTPDDLLAFTGFSDFESYIDTEDNRRQYINYPVCRECVSQSKCSPYGGHHPYKWEAEIYGEELNYERTVHNILLDQSFSKGGSGGAKG